MGMYEVVKKAFPEKFAATSFYHYTTSKVLDELVKDDAHLYCTSTDDLNDEVEFSHGLSLGLDYLKRMYGVGSGMLRSIEDTIGMLKAKKMWHGWVMSLSSKKDDLGQWRAYTDPKEGGYAVEFDAHQMRMLIERRTHMWHKKEDALGAPVPVILYIFPCFYEGHDDAVRLLDIFFKEFAPAYSHLVQARDVNESLRLVATVLSLLLLFASVYKQESFHDESETRLVMLNQFAPGSEDCKPVVVGGKLRLPIPLFPELLKVRDVIKSVCRSPHGNRTFLEEHANDLKRSFNCSFSCEKSRSTFRGN